MKHIVRIKIIYFISRSKHEVDKKIVEGYGCDLCFTFLFK